MMQSEMLEPLPWFFWSNAPTYWHHQTIEGLLLVARGAEPPWAREFASTEDTSHASLPAGEGCFSCPLAGLQARTPAECVQANAVLGTLLGNPAFWLYTQTDKKGFFFFFFPFKPLPGRWIRISPTSGVKSGKPSSELLKRLLQGYFSSKS